jgi:hypothetical protein
VSHRAKAHRSRGKRRTDHQPRDRRGSPPTRPATGGVLWEALRAMVDLSSDPKADTHHDKSKPHRNDPSRRSWNSCVGRYCSPDHGIPRRALLNLRLMSGTIRYVFEKMKSGFARSSLRKKDLNLRWHKYHFEDLPWKLVAVSVILASGTL